MAGTPHKPGLTYAHSDRHGVITFSPEPWEHGRVQIGFGGKGFRDKVSRWARHCRYTDALLVPGVPEAKSENDAVDAAGRFRRLIEAAA